MTKTVDLFRHTDNDGDELTEDGVRAAVDLGRRLQSDYDLLVSSGAQRATQAAACVLCGMAKPVEGGVVVDRSFRSAVEDRWRDVARLAPGKDLRAFAEVDSELVEGEARVLGAALRELLDRLPEDGCALVMGHSPTQEAAVLGLCGEVVSALGKGAGVRVVEDSGVYRVSDLR